MSRQELQYCLDGTKRFMSKAPTSVKASEGTHYNILMPNKDKARDYIELNDDSAAGSAFHQTYHQKEAERLRRAAIPTMRQIYEHSLENRLQIESDEHLAKQLNRVHAGRVETRGYNIMVPDSADHQRPSEPTKYWVQPHLGRRMSPVNLQWSRDGVADKPAGLVYGEAALTVPERLPKGLGPGGLACSAGGHWGRQGGGAVIPLPSTERRMPFAGLYPAPALPTPATTYKPKDYAAGLGSIPTKFTKIRPPRLGDSTSLW